MKRVIIIGASSGIGRLIAEYYASNGCRVAIAARREDNLKETARKYPQNILYCAMDVTDCNSPQVFQDMTDSLGGVDLVIYCSGYGKYSHDLLLETEHNTVDVNIKGFLNVVIPAFNYFASRKEQPQYKPQIVTISSVASVRGLGSSPAYSATKRFQTIYFEALAQLSSIKDANIDFTAIKPGFIATDFISRKYPCTMQLTYAVRKIVRAIEKRKKNAVIDW